MNIDELLSAKNLKFCEIGGLFRFIVILHEGKITIKIKIFHRPAAKRVSVDSDIVDDFPGR